jgi:uncharacterized BrkB/YihY/UPF0761 family membrane protein
MLGLYVFWLFILIGGELCFAVQRVADSGADPAALEPCQPGPPI